jgi:monovalent cation:H+ antiporter-2, CPA2 family
MTLPLDSTGFSDALVILGAAGLVIPAFARARITPVIGFILVGVLVGPHGLGAPDLIAKSPWLYYVSITDRGSIDPFAELGIILLLFSIGLELSFRRLWGMRQRVIGFGASQLVLSALLIAIALAILGSSSPSAIGLGVALALSSTALVLPISGTTSAVGRLAFAMLLFEDLALVPIIFTLGALAGGGLDGLITVAVSGAITIAIMLVVGWFALPLLFSQAARTKSPELFLSASLLVVILASVATTAVGLSPIVGALVAGLLIAETDYAVEVESVIAPLKGLALGVFLISVGMNLDLDLIARQWPLLIAAIVGVVLVKTVVVTVLLRFGGVRTGVATETGVLMASPSETTLIVLAAAAQVGLIAADDAAFWQVVTAIGLTITPLLARIGHDFARRIEMREVQPADEPDAATPRTIIVGFGRVGVMVADMLDVHGRRWVAVEANVDAVTAARRAGRPVRFGDAGRMETLEHLGVASASAVVFTMDDPVQILRLTRKLRDRFPRLTIIARSRDTDHAAALYRAGVSDAIPETLESSLQLAEAVLVDLGVAIGPVIASIHNKRDELRAQIKSAGMLDAAPKLKSS